MFKVGDSLIVTGTTDHFIPVGSKVTVVEVDNDDPIRTYQVEDERGSSQWVYNDDLQQFSPPEKITQNGYEYSLVGPVKPEWMIDGAWVVRKDNGETHQINQKSENMFSATSSLSRVTGLTLKRVSDEFRPHTDKDWKWGDWALYEGKRVFVMTKADSEGCVAISHPNIWGNDITNAPDQLKRVRSSTLTPTF